MILKVKTRLFNFLVLTVFLPAGFSYGQEMSRLTLHLDSSLHAVSPHLYGLMTEEINYSYDGGLYAEQIRNRIFRDNPREPDHWSLLKSRGNTSTMHIDDHDPVNSILKVSLRVDVAGNGPAGLANSGFWGIAVKPSTVYHGSFYARSSNQSDPAFTVCIESADGKTTYASAEVPTITTGWRKYQFTLTTRAGIKPTADTRFVIRMTSAGSYWFSLVSLFPPTFNDTPNGNRLDIMQLLAGMKPGFLRLPGGNYLEGNTFSERFQWQKTVGPLEDRGGHESPWGYRSSDGLGLLEYLEWCEDLKMEPVLAVFAGYVLNHDHLEAGPFLEPFVQDALNEIEYITGDTTTQWGKRRALDGHPAPFELHYVEIGNEDGFDYSGSYEGRFTQFYRAIKAKYPYLQIISTVGGKDPLGKRLMVTSCKPDVIDEHYYRNAFEMERDAGHYDNYDRKGPKIFVGEWATREGSPTTDFNAALGDAAWMTGMERNSDIVVMSCYAPLFVNVNKGAMQWHSDLIGYNASSCYGSPSFYAQKMFNTYRGDEVIKVDGEQIPLQTQKLTAKDSLAGVKPQKYPALFYVATRDSQSGTVYLKIVNTQSRPQPLRIVLDGAAKINKTARIVQLKADSPLATNSIENPEKIIPATSELRGVKKSFVHVFPAYSISVLQIGTLK